MTTYKFSEKKPIKDQYCFIKNGEQWIFCMYQGTEEQPDMWGFFRNPSSLNLGVIEEWNPALIRLANPSVDVISRKVTYDLIDVVDDESTSFIDSFTASVGEPNANSNSDGNNGNLEGRGVDLQAEVPVLRADSIESAQCTVGCIPR